MEKERINIKSRFRDDLCTKLELNRQTYIVETESSAKDAMCVTSKIYMDGRIISAQRHNLRKSLSTLSPEKLSELIEWHHQNTLEKFKEHCSTPAKASSYYLDEANTLLRRKNFQNALGIIAEGLKEYPEDPLLISYYGYVTAKVHGNHKMGIRECWRAIRILEKMVPSDLEFIYPTPFLNLGRVYLEAEDKKSAIDIFSRVLHFDHDNHGARMEMKSLGERKKLLFPFLKRNNPLNKYTGMLRHRFGGREATC